MKCAVADLASDVVVLDVAPASNQARTRERTERSRGLVGGRELNPFEVA